MRISSIESDPGFQNYLEYERTKYKTHACLILVDGLVGESRVYIADEEQGYVLRAKLDDKGDFIKDTAVPNGWVCEEVYGTVEIRFVERVPYPMTIQ